jgi:hypothetical protein
MNQMEKDTKFDILVLKQQIDRGIQEKDLIGKVIVLEK